MEEALFALQQAHAAQGDPVAALPRDPGGQGMASIVERTRDFTQEVIDELKKVTWPDWDQLRSATIVVILFTVAISAVIWLMDSVVSWVVGLIMGMFGA